MSAEHAVLGCVLTDNRMYRAASQIITGSDFADARLGMVWDGIGAVLVTGRGVDAASVSLHFPDWGVRGVDAAEPWQWVSASGDVPVWAEDYARTVKGDAVRRNGRVVLSSALAQLDDSGSDPELVLGQVVRAVQESQSAEQGLEAVSLKDIISAEDSFDWVIPNLMERKDRLIITGPEGMGKSTLARQLIILPAAGLHPFTFERIEPVKALVIDAENTAKQWKRNAGWLRSQAHQQGQVDPAGNVQMAISGRVNLLDPRILGQIHRLIDQHTPDIVFIGPLYRLAVKLNSDEDVSPVIAALDSVRDRGVALVIEAHAGHAVGPNGVRDVRPRGSSALMGWPEFGFGIRSDQEALKLGRQEFDFVAWRGAREERDFPAKLRRGLRERAEFPWVVVE